MEAYPYRLPIRPSSEPFLEVTVDIFQQDIYRIFESASSNEVSQESVDEPIHLTRVTTLVPCKLIWSEGLEEEIATLLTSLNLGPENYSQAMEALPNFVRERAREALEGGFHGLLVVLTVDHLETFVVQEPVIGAHKGTIDDNDHPLISIEAYTDRLPTKPLTEQSNEVIVDIFQQDIYRIIHSEASGQVTEESVVETFRCTRLEMVEPQNFVGSVVWEGSIATLLGTLDLELETYSQAMQELPRYVRERTSAALQDGLNVLSVVCNVRQVHTYVVEEQLTGADDGVDSEALFLQAMADGKIRCLLCMNNDNSCRICLEEFLDGSEMYELGCSHAYHPECIRRWFDECHQFHRKCRCPVCRELL